jgi:hypothetical protein
MKEFFKSFLDRTFTYLAHQPYNKLLISQQSMEYLRVRDDVRARTPENVALHGAKVYSQTDEDGIIAEIFRRIPNSKSFLEIGIQDGTECNTLALLLNGWKGVWIEGSDAHCNTIASALGRKSFPGRLNVVNSFIDVDNITPLVLDACKFVNVKELDFFSLDIDGNDFYIIEKILSQHIRPKVFCVEYNGKFPPPIRVKIAYNPTHVWDRSEYQGASLQTFTDLFESHGYSLLCCNVTGINAFFVEDTYMKYFTRYSIADLFQASRYHLSPMIVGAPASLRFLKNELESKA